MLGVGVEAVDQLGLHQTVSKENGTDRSGGTSWSQGVRNKVASLERETCESEMALKLSVIVSNPQFRVETFYCKPVLHSLYWPVQAKQWVEQVSQPLE